MTCWIESQKKLLTMRIAHEAAIPAVDIAVRTRSTQSSMFTVFVADPSDSTTPRQAAEARGLTAGSTRLGLELSRRPRRGSTCQVWPIARQAWMLSRHVLRP